jgi:hypothetical protein
MKRFSSAHFARRFLTPALRARRSARENPRRRAALPTISFPVFLAQAKGIFQKNG